MCSECKKQVDLVNIRSLGKRRVYLFIKLTQSLRPQSIHESTLSSRRSARTPGAFTDGLFCLFGNKLILPDRLTYFPWVILCLHGFPYALYITVSCVHCIIGHRHNNDYNNNKGMTWYLSRRTQFPDVRHHTAKQGSKHSAEQCLNNTARRYKTILCILTTDPCGSKVSLSTTYHFCTPSSSNWS